jgi:hypothetical protein
MLAAESVEPLANVIVPGRFALVPPTVAAAETFS